MKLVHIITDLEDGGAESVLFNLCVNSPEHYHIVISLMGPGKYGDLLIKSGIQVHCLDFPQGRLTLRGIVKLSRILESEQPDALQTWMYHANLVGGLVAYFLGIRNISWGIHNATVDPRVRKSTTNLVNNICAKLSWHLPSKIVFCAQNALDVHRAQGYCPDKLTVIHNGHDLIRFSVDDIGGASIRQEMCLSPETPLIGMVARFDPQKDHENLLSALQLVKGQIPNIKCLLIGAHMDTQNALLWRSIQKRGLSSVVTLLGQRSDIPAIMNALDLHVLSSRGEAFPNVLNEAMACGIPCISTKVGDAEIILGDTGWIVPREDPRALGTAILDAFTEKSGNPEQWNSRKHSARKRIEENFSLNHMVCKYNELWLR